METSWIQRTQQELPMPLPVCPGRATRSGIGTPRAVKKIPPAYPEGSSVQASQRKAEEKHFTNHTLPA
eukprot:2940664-Amphidinium_carterae.1